MANAEALPVVGMTLSRSRDKKPTIITMRHGPSREGWALVKLLIGSPIFCRVQRRRNCLTENVPHDPVSLSKIPPLPPSCKCQTYALKPMTHLMLDVFIVSLHSYRTTRFLPVLKHINCKCRLCTSRRNPSTDIHHFKMKLIFIADILPRYYLPLPQLRTVRIGHACRFKI